MAKTDTKSKTVMLQITVEIEENRHNSLRDQLILKGKTVEGELADAMKKLYEKHVPAALRAHHDKQYPLAASTGEGLPL